MTLETPELATGDSSPTWNVANVNIKHDGTLYRPLGGCPVCHGRLVVLGRLDGLTWFRCWGCGAEFPFAPRPGVAYTTGNGAVTRST